MSDAIRKTSEFDGPEWHHTRDDADWEQNTDNQNDAAVENLTEGPAPQKKGSGIQRIAVEDENDSKGLQQNNADVGATNIEDTEDLDEEVRDAEDTVDDVETDQVSGEFELADDPAQFENGADIMWGGMAGTVTGATDVDGESYIKVKLENEATGYFHWKDLLVYIPTEEDLANEIERPSLETVALNWSRLSKRNGWVGVTDLPSLDSHVVYRGETMRVIGHLDDGRIQLLAGDAVGDGGNEVVVRVDGLD